MKVPKLARYNGTVSKAYEFIEHNIIEFPINLIDLINRRKWGLLTYEQMALNNHCGIGDICECFGPDGYSICNGKNYTIAYNNKKSHGRINFTLAHEIGHIILGHHKDFDVTSVLADNFSKEEYKILENEANCFARNILAPAPLISELNFLGIMFKIPDIFDITLPASTTRISLLKNDLYYLSEDQIIKIKSKFRRYKTCNNCSLKYLDIGMNYCPLCGNKKLVLGDVFSMKEYKGINIKELHECPRCENYDINFSEDKFCKICGIKLHNECTQCEMELDASARYCTQCGHVTSYFSSGILKDWKVADDVADSNTTNEFEDLPF